MTTSTAIRPTLEDLAFDTICLGRELAHAASLADFGVGDTGFGQIPEVLVRLADRNPFDGADDHFLTALRIVLDAELASEVIGTEWRVPCADDCEPGEFLLPRERPMYSERGRQVLHIVELFERFMAARAAALDRAAAERALATLRGV